MHFAKIEVLKEEDRKPNVLALNRILFIEETSFQDKGKKEITISFNVLISLKDRL